MNRVLLLDETDTTLRRIQHGAMVGGILILLVAQAVASRPGRLAIVLAIIAAGIALFVAGSRFKQRWETTYKGHTIRYENNPFTGEKLFIDDAIAGKGKLGFTSEIRAWIPDGDGVGDEILARSEAGFLSFRCTIEVHPRSAGVDALSNEELLNELQRRRLGPTLG